MRSKLGVFLVVASEFCRSIDRFDALWRDVNEADGVVIPRTIPAFNPSRGFLVCV